MKQLRNGVENPDRAVAKAEGRTTYAGLPCAKCGGVLRKTHSGSCVGCANEASRQWAKDDPARNRAKAARFRKEVDPVGVRRIHVKAQLKRNYGITPQQYDAMHAEQSGRCPICSRVLIRQTDETREFKGHLAIDVARVDHCHETGRVRGLLCSGCNVGLGMFREQPKFLLNAVGYLRANATLQAQPMADRKTASEIEPGNRDLESSVSRVSRRAELSPFI